MFKKTTVSEFSYFTDLSKNTTPITEMMKCFHASDTSLLDEIEFQKVSPIIPSTATNASSKLFRENETCEPGFSKYPKIDMQFLNGPAFLTSTVLPPTLKLAQRLDLRWDVSSKSVPPIEKFQFRPYRTWLFMVWTPYKFHVNPNRYKDHRFSYAYEQLAPLSARF